MAWWKSIIWSVFSNNFQEKFCIKGKFWADFSQEEHWITSQNYDGETRNYLKLHFQEWLQTTCFQYNPKKLTDQADSQNVEKDSAFNDPKSFRPLYNRNKQWKNISVKEFAHASKSNDIGFSKLYLLCPAFIYGKNLLDGLPEKKTTWCVKNCLRKRSRFRQFHKTKNTTKTLGIQFPPKNSLVSLRRP